MRKKLKKFEDNDKSLNVVQPGKPIFEEIKGNWHSEIFKNDHPITVEMGCGYGEYTVGLARHYPDRNFIGIDIKGARIWRGSQQAQEEGLTNVAFLRTKIDHITDLFAPNEVSEIWITFPDPRPRDRDIKRRLTSLPFMNFYKQISKDGATFHLKTDSIELFEFTLEVLQEMEGVRNLEHTFDLYQSYMHNDHLGIKTRYEKLFTEKGYKINYLRFQLFQ